MLEVGGTRYKWKGAWFQRKARDRVMMRVEGNKKEA